MWQFNKTVERGRIWFAFVDVFQIHCLLSDFSGKAFAPMSDANELGASIMQEQARDESELFAALFESLGESHAIGRDPVRGGEESFYALIARIQGKLCDSVTVTMIRQDFNMSGPVVAALLLADQYFSKLGHATTLYLGALIVKLGVDRLCQQKH